MFDSFFEFLYDYPIVAIFLAYWVFNLLFGRKKGQKARKEPTPRAVQQRNARKPQFREVVNRLEQAVEEAQRKYGDANRPDPPKNVQYVPASPVATPPVAEPDPFAFHSLLEPSARASEAIDYDIAAQDYDITGASYDAGAGPRVFPSATDDEAYHINSFRGFHMAHGLSSKDREAIDAEAVESTRSAVSSLFSGPGDLRRAFIMQEILGPPKGLRPRGR